MPVKLYEWDKNETWWTAIEVTANKVINLLLRSEDNLLKTEDNELYCDLQLEDGLTTSDTLPVGVTTGRVLSTDGWVASWTMLCFKTTSWDYVTWIYGDDWKLYIDNGSWTFKQIYLKTEVDALFTQLRWEISNVWYSWAYADITWKPWVVEIEISEDNNWDARWNITWWTLIDGSVVLVDIDNLLTITDITSFYLSTDEVDLVPWIASVSNGDVFTWMYKEQNGVKGIFVWQKRTPTP